MKANQMKKTGYKTLLSIAAVLSLSASALAEYSLTCNPVMIDFTKSNGKKSSGVYLPLDIEGVKELSASGIGSVYFGGRGIAMGSSEIPDLSIHFLEAVSVYPTADSNFLILGLMLDPADLRVSGKVAPHFNQLSTKLTLTQWEILTACTVSQSSSR